MIWGCLAFPTLVNSSWSLQEVEWVPQEMPFALSQMCLHTDPIPWSKGHLIRENSHLLNK